MDYKGKLAFITGGSSGIGLAIAKELAARGTNLLLISRSEAKLAEAKSAAEAAAGGQSITVETLPLDVANREKVMSALAASMDRLGVPDFVINSAGFAHPAYFEDIPHNRFEEMLGVNLIGVWNVLQAVVPSMKKRGSGNIASVSSIVGTFSFVGYSGYSATKFGVIGMSEALRNELSAFGITVQTVLAPDTDTPGFEQENKTKPHETHVVSGSSKVHTPEAVAKAFLKQFGKRKFFIVYGYMAFVHTLFRLFPWLVRGVFDSDYKKARKQVAAGQVPDRGAAK